jgi:hypothetical protein
LVLYSATESLRIPDWIDVVHAEDLRFSPNLREVIAGLQREIGGFRDCQKPERIELSQSVEVIGEGAFRADENERRGGAAARAQTMFLDGRRRRVAWEKAASIPCFHCRERARKRR